MRKNHKKIFRVIGVFMGGIGLLLVLSVFMPVLSYELVSGANFTNFLSPIPENSGSGDYTKASSWFPDVNSADFKSSIAYYNLSVPKLGIKDAVVSVGGEDLADSLIQYPGTALPGKKGNTVIFGHSALPAFYNPREYLTIFSTLPTLKKGDEISVVFDGISYVYKVSDIYEVFPTNLGILSQDTDEKTLSLVTCVPPGDPRNPKRLIVKTILVPSTQIKNYDNNRV